MIDNEKLVVYLNTFVNSVFKILPLYELQVNDNKDVGLEIYMESLLFELYGLNKVVDIENSYEYISLLSTLESVKVEIMNEESKKATIKREVFKCINVIKKMITKLEDGE